MTKPEKAVKVLISDIENKTILEAACGTAQFSIAASEYAKDIFCVDIDDSRLDPKTNERKNIHFEIMDASSMNFPNEKFDSIFIYNAFSHIKDQWKEIEKECKRVLKQNGSIYIIGTWKIDTALMESMFGENVKRNDEFFIVELTCH